MNLLQNFDPSTMFIGRNVFHYPKVESTNLVLKDMARSGNVPEGTLVFAEEQSAGRGRQGRNWFGTKGQNVFASFLLKPNFLEVDQQAGINFCISLAIADTLREFMPYARINIKWPNDVLLNNGKIAGILVESTIGKRSLEQVIAGIGINVNERSFPNELDFATSMLQQSGNAFRITDVIEVLCRKLEQRYQQLKLKEGIISLCREYNELLFSKGKKVTILLDGKEVAGSVVNVDNTGHIAIQMDEGIMKFSQGEIKLNVYGTSN